MEMTYRTSFKKSAFLGLIFVLSIYCLTISTFPVYAGVRWTADGVAICIEPDGQDDPILISDGAGGAIIAWEDVRGADWDIYAQRIGNDGTVKWTANGEVICQAVNNQNQLAIESDGGGGVIIAWRDYRDSLVHPDIYAQRIDSGGTVKWTANGVVIYTAAEAQYEPAIVSDGNGGAIIAWEDYRNITDSDIYAQRVDADGVTQWTINGVAICNASNHQRYPTIASDDNGGAIITWQDQRAGTRDIYAQRIDADGDVKWTAGGVVISQAADDQWFPIIVSDGSRGAIITWEDYRSTLADVYAQRVNSDGDVQWTTNGVAISAATDHQCLRSITNDGYGGAIIAWEDKRSGTSWDIYTQQVNSDGDVQWTTNGVAICTSDNDQGYPDISSDGAGGAIIAWQDQRGATRDVYAQRIDADGNVQWTTNGVAICKALDNQWEPAIVSDGTGGAIIVWEDFRNSPDYDIYSQRISNDPPQITSITPDYGPNDSPVDITDLEGNNFFLNPIIKLTRSGCSDIIATNIDVVSWTQITCEFDLTDKELGIWDLLLINTDEQSDTLSNCFEVKKGVPTEAGEVSIQGGENGYVNPSRREEAKIHFTAEDSGKATIKIYTLRGQLVWEYTRETDGEKDFITWDCKNIDESVVSSGIYIIYIEAPGIETTRKVAILR